MSTPRISVNKLGEYLIANPARRRKIVYDAKYPSAPIFSRYRVARETVRGYIIKGFDPKIISAGKKKISSVPKGSDFQENDKKSSLAALDSMLSITSIPAISGLTVSEYKGANPKLVYSDVEVSVNPDLLIKGKHRKKDIVGAIKIHISKGNQLSQEQMRYVSVLLKEFTENSIASAGEEVSRKHCISVDVFKTDFEECPSSVARRLDRIEAACEEIAMWWDRL